MQQPDIHPTVGPSAAAGKDVSFSVVGAKSKEPQIESGIDQSLEVTLTNTGAPIPLVAGDAPSTMTVFLPRYVDAASIRSMKISLKDWSFAIAANGLSLVLTYAGAGEDWQGRLSFVITDVKVVGAAASGRAEIQLKDMTGAPARLSQPLMLVEPPTPGNASLRDVLSVSIDNRGTVYVSNPYDPLSNSLFLNVKNIGPEALYTGEELPSGAEIKVEFCYGSTAGALAPADSTDRKTKPLGSAWNIVGGVYEDQTDGWRVDPATSLDPVPVWTLRPENTNKTLIDAQSNVTFDFSNIVALTPVGHTQMILSFSGFKKTGTKRYDDMVLTLDVVKEHPPPNRGLLNFFGTDAPVVPVSTASTAVEIPLRWAMASVNRIDMITSFPGVPPYSRVYAERPAAPKALDFDKHSIRIPTVTQSGPVTATLQARNAEGAFLNALQFTTYLQMMVFVDPRDDEEYPVALLGDKFWMTENLRYKEPGSVVYADEPTYERKYGRMYDAASQSVRSPPGGWHIPSERDWRSLIALYGDGKAAYGPLTATGDGKFAAVLGGKYLPDGRPDFSDITELGYYHVSREEVVAGFSALSNEVSVNGNMYPGEKISIRYVRDL